MDVYISYLSRCTSSNWSSVLRTIYTLSFRNIMLAYPLYYSRLFRLLLGEMWWYRHLYVDVL